MFILPKICPVCDHEPLTFDRFTAVCGSCNVYRRRLTLTQSMTLWTHNHGGWWWRGILVLGVIFSFFKGLSSPEFVMGRANPFSAADLGIHELGHILFIPFGHFMTVLGGSLFQLLFPLMWLAACLYKRWFFAACMCLSWFGFSLLDVGIYAGDARDQTLSLVSLDVSGGAVHDWFEILFQLHHLEWDEPIAATLHIAGGVCMGLGIALATALIVGIVWAKRSQEDPAAEE